MDIHRPTEVAALGLNLESVGGLAFVSKFYKVGRGYSYFCFIVLGLETSLFNGGLRAELLL